MLAHLAGNAHSLHASVMLVAQGTYQGEGDEGAYEDHVLGELLL
jgi:hypothetical protein